MEENPTIAHLVNEKFNDALHGGMRSTVINKTPWGFSRFHLKGGFDTISKLILADAKEGRDFVWVPDTNVKILNKAFPIWDSLQRAYTYDFKPKALLTSPIYSELRDWLLDPSKTVFPVAFRKSCFPKR